MTTLAIETATTACAIALEINGEVIERVLDRERRHTESLTPGVRDLLREHSTSVSDLNRIVVDRGPGLFTGLRVGLAVALGLARGLGVDLVEVTSLECLATSAADAGVSGPLLVAVDARRGELFVQQFELTERVTSTSEPEVLRPEVLIERGVRGLRVVGDGAVRHLHALVAGGAEVIEGHEIPSPGAAIALAATRTASENVHPLYLREADAVANFSQRLGS